MYSEINAHQTERNKPILTTQFSELPISARLQEQLAAASFTTMTPVQSAAIPQALAGKDVLATAQTGTGKTLAFLVPMLEQLLKHHVPAVTALVLVPTRELAMQVAEQYDALRGNRLPAAAQVVGGIQERSQLMAIRKGARLIVATPGRLEDFLDRKLVDFRGLNLLVLDEADRMLDMGFLPSIRRIVSILPAQRQTLCFSATLPAQVVQLVNQYTRNPVRVALGSTTKPCENVRIQAFEVLIDEKQSLLERLLDKEDGTCLVFVRTKHGADRLAHRLTRDGFAATVIHGDRSQAQRTAALTGFQQGRFRVLVATDLASRGIHVEGIAHVINYDLPMVADDLIHRVGRTGRAGETGIASVFFGRDQAGDLRSLERTLGLRIERKSVSSLGQQSVDTTKNTDASKNAVLEPAENPRSSMRSGSRSRRSGSHKARAAAQRDVAVDTERQSESRMSRLPGESFQLKASRA